MVARVATQLNVPHALMVAATEQAKREGISRAEFIRRAIAAKVKLAA